MESLLNLVYGKPKGVVEIQLRDTSAEDRCQQAVGWGFGRVPSHRRRDEVAARTCPSDPLAALRAE
jgi:hypothetical protein